MTNRGEFMLSTLKKFIIFLVILTVVTIFGIYAFSMNRTYSNSEDEIGNTTGNIYNGGLFCEQDDNIFFSNDKNNGSLYVMNSNCTNARKVSDETASYINADGNYIYFVKSNTSTNNDKSIFRINNSGIYRINQNGSELKSVSNNPGAYLTLKGNNLFYQHYDAENGLYFYSNKIDCSSERLLEKVADIPAFVTNDKLYFTSLEKDHSIYSLNLQSFTTRLLLSGNYLYPIYIGDYIYYMDPLKEYKIYRMKLDGSEPTLLVNERCSTFNITNTGKFLYYQIDNGKKSRICSLNLKTMKANTLLAGNYKQINVTDNFVFFRTLDETQTYMTAAEGGTTVSTFNPQKLIKK